MRITPTLTDAEIRAALTGAEHWIYLAVGPNCWGKGFTPEQALDAAAQENRAARAHHLIYAVTDPWATIDGMGGICYTPRQPLDRTNREYIEIARKGKDR